MSAHFPSGRDGDQGAAGRPAGERLGIPRRSLLKGAAATAVVVAIDAGVLGYAAPKRAFAAEGRPCLNPDLLWTARSVALVPDPGPGLQAHIYALASDGDLVYVTHETCPADAAASPVGPGSLSVIDVRTLDLVARTTVGWQPYGLSVDPGGARVQVMNYGPADSDIAVVDAASWEVVERLPVGSTPHSVLSDPARDRVFVTNSYTGRLQSFTASTGQALPWLDLPPTPKSMALDARRGVVHIVLMWEGDPLTSALACVDAATGELLRVMPVGPPTTTPYEVAVNAATDRVYLTVLGTRDTTPADQAVPCGVLAVDGETGSVLAVAPTPFARGIAVDPRTDRVYAVNDSGDLVVLDGATLAVIDTVHIGTWPSSVAVDEAGRIAVGDYATGTLHLLTALDLNDPIGRKWQAVGPDTAGDPLSGVLPTPDGAGVLQHFTHGTIVHSADYGAVWLTTPMAEAWQSAGQGAGLGLPTADTVSWNGGLSTTFQRGRLVTPASGTAVAAAPPVLLPAVAALAYAKLGAEQGLLGRPRSGAESRPGGGWRIPFDGGDLYWSAASGAHEVHGYIKQRFDALGGVEALGYPLTGERPVRGDQGDIGRSNRFQRGTIVWSHPTGAWEVLGDIRLVWENENGGAGGDLGLPVGPQRSTPTSGGRYTDFERGVIVTHDDGPYRGTFAFTTLQLFVARFAGHGSDEAGSSNLSLRIQHLIAVDGQAVSSGAMPGEDDDYGTGDVTVNLTYPLTDLVRGDLTVTVMFEGWDVDSWSSDDRLGTIDRGYDDSPYNEHLQPPYSVDNLWGLLEPVEKDDDAFSVWYTLGPASVPADPDKPFTDQGWWGFRNFRTPTLSGAQYAYTFADVDDNDGWWKSFNPATYLDEAWEWLFYNVFYKGVAAPGNCFGMCLEALYSLDSRSLFTEPIHRFAESDDLHYEINIKHGYQVGVESLAYMVDQFALGRTHDPIGAFERSRDAFAQGDPPILALSEFWFGESHAVLPVPRAESWDQSSWPWTIDVADPNRPVGEAGGDQARRILIHQDNTFTFDSPNTQYTGGDLIGARLYHIPYSLVSSQPHTSLLEGLTLVGLGLVTAILGSASGVTRQITDDGGRTLFRTGLSTAPAGWSDLARANRIPGLAPVPRLGQAPGGGSPSAELYVSDDSVRDLAYDVAAAPGESCLWATLFPGMAVTLAIPGGGAADRIVAQRTGTSDRRVRISGAADGPVRPMAARLESLPGSGSEARFAVTGLPIRPGPSATLWTEDAGSDLLIHNEGDDTTVGVAWGRGSRTPLAMAPKQVLLKGGALNRLTPLSWDANAGSVISLRVRTADPATGRSLGCVEL